MSKESQSLEPIEVFFPAQWLARLAKYPRARWGSEGSVETPGWISPKVETAYRVEFPDHFDSDISSDDLKTLADWAKNGKLPGLTSICFDASAITDAKLALLCELPELQELELESMMVAPLKRRSRTTRPDTNPCLPHLSALTGLQKLSLRNCLVNDADIIGLRGLTVLSELRIRDCYEVTQAAVATLGTTLPRCHIDFHNSTS